MGLKKWKMRFNPLIEQLGTMLFGVDQYADIFERLALAPRTGAFSWALPERRLPADIAEAPLLFIHVPKNGGTSVKRALYRSDPGHATLRYYERFFPASLAHKETLALIRDPVDRFLSGFDFLMNGGGGDVRIQPRPLRRMQQVRTTDDFLDFIETAGGDWLKVDTFARPQHWYIANSRNQIGVNHLWLLERSKPLTEFLGVYGIQTLPHANRTRRQDRSLTEEQIERLKRLYPEDFALYDLLKANGGYSSALTGRAVSASSLRVTSASKLS